MTKCTGMVNMGLTVKQMLCVLSVNFDIKVKTKVVSRSFCFFQMSVAYCNVMKHIQRLGVNVTTKLQTLLRVSHGFNRLSVYNTLAPGKRQAWQQAQPTANLWSDGARQCGMDTPITMEIGS